MGWKFNTLTNGERVQAMVLVDEAGNVIIPGGGSSNEFASIKVGDIANGNYVEFNVDGLEVMHGDATVYNDLRVSLETMNTAGANAPDEVLFKNQSATPATANCAYFLQQSGAGNLIIPNTTDYDLTSAYSFEFWFFADTDLKDWQELFRKRNMLQIRTASNNALSFDTPIGYTTTPQNAFTRNAWNHVMVTYTGTGGSGDDTFNFYINDVQVGTQNGWGEANNNANELRFNRSETVWRLDNVIFWQKELTAAERATSYNAGNGRDYTTYTDMKGYWKLNESSGSVVSDSTTYANNGSITGTESVDFKWDLGVVTSQQGTIGVRIYNFDASEHHEVFFSVQLPHTWLEGSAVHGHVHVVGLDADEIGHASVFGLEFTKAKPGDLFSDTTIIKTTGYASGSDTIKDKHQVLKFPAIDMTGDTISTMIMCRLFRDPADANDTYTGNVGLLEFDFHYISNSQGSNNEWSK